MHRPVVPVVGTQIPPFLHGFIEQKVAGTAEVVEAVTVAAELVTGTAVAGGRVTKPGLMLQ